MAIIRILAMTGSLRQESSNTTLLRAMAALAPEHIKIDLYQDIGELPFFNPDLDEAKQPTVIHLKNKLRLSDGLIIASPEYAHGMTGVLKNALDWLVSSEEFINKPIALLNASSRATHAHAALTEVVKTMSGQIVDAASLTIPITPGKTLNKAEIISDPKLSGLIHTVIEEFAKSL